MGCNPSNMLAYKYVSFLYNKLFSEISTNQIYAELNAQEENRGRI